jgi:hypothetical protein
MFENMCSGEYVEETGQQELHTEELHDFYA